MTCHLKDSPPPKKKIKKICHLKDSKVFTFDLLNSLMKVSSLQTLLVLPVSAYCLTFRGSTSLLMP